MKVFTCTECADFYFESGRDQMCQHCVNYLIEVTTGSGCTCSACQHPPCAACSSGWVPAEWYDTQIIRDLNKFRIFLIRPLT